MVPDPPDPDSTATPLERLLALLQLDDDERRRELDRIRRSNPAAGKVLDRLLAQGDAARAEGILAGNGRRPTHALAPGDRVGPYQIDRVLGRGGMGTVYLAYRRDDFLQEVAVKVMRPGLPERLEARFEAERQYHARLKHPGIVYVHSGGADADGAPYLVMEYVDGVHLDEYCRAHAATVESRVRLVHAVAEALAYAHRQGVVHRDLKPSNILVGDDGRPRVTDFGLAKLVAAAVDGSATKATDAGLLMGTPSYMAPERLAAAPGRDDPAVDVYALGVILFLLLTDRLPFDAGRPTEGLARAAREDAPSPRRIVGSIPRDLETITAKALAHDPRDRFRDAGAMAEQIRRYLAGEPLSIRPPTRAERLAKWAVRRRRALLAWAASFAVVLVAMIAVQAYWNRQLRRDRDALRGTTRAMWLASTRLMEKLPTDEPAVMPFYEQLSRSFESVRDRGLIDVDPALDRGVAVMHRHFGSALLASSKPAEALRLLDRSIALLRPLPPKIDDPATRAWTEFDLFRGLIERASAFRRLGRLDAALADSDEAVGVIRALGGRFPDEPARLEAEACQLLGRESPLRALGRISDARRDVVEAVRLAERSVDLAGPEADAVKLETLCWAGKQAADLASRPDERERFLRSACAAAERLQGFPGPHLTTDERCAGAWLGLGAVLLERGRTAEALPLYEKAGAAIDRLLARRPAISWYQSMRVDASQALDRCRRSTLAAP